MILYSSPSSPYARKIRAALHEIGAHKRVRVVDVDTRDPQSGLWQASPAGRIPVLVVDGITIHDSPVILQWVDATFGDRPGGAGLRLLPASGTARWDALTREATGDGLTDTLVPMRMEVLRPAGEQSRTFLEKSRDRVLRILDGMEHDTVRFPPVDAVDVGALGLACSLGYLEFRFPDIEWRPARPALAGWYEAFSQRASLRLTVPYNLGESPPVVR
jgi:glutathione S-transferase